MRSMLKAAVVAAALAAVGPTQAQPNLEKLKQFKVSGTDLNIPVVPQTGKNADRVVVEPGATATIAECLASLVAPYVKRTTTPRTRAACRESPRTSLFIITPSSNAR